MTLQSAATHDAEIAALAPWFHNLHLPDGRETAPDHPLGDFPAYKWEEIAPYVPADLAGATALDIGCNAGFYTFELARRGARVTGLELDEHYLAQARWAARKFDVADRVEFRQGTVYDLARTDERWDVVLFMGVLYHLRHPLLGLDIAAFRTGGTLIFQTLTTDEAPAPDDPTTPADLPLSERHRLSDPQWPRMSFIEHAFASDRTNWWVPTPGCCRAMLRSVGMQIEASPGHETWICRRRERERVLAPELASLLGPGNG
jgi:tRNA (mo5U34)-methyltransferase